MAKALDDVILAYEMNGEPLLPDHGYPVRVIVPHWAGIASIKWVGQIEVSATPLVSYWNTQAYRLFGPAYPPGGTFITTQPVRSAFELDWNARLPANQEYVLTGRSWSGSGPITRTEISTGGGGTGTWPCRATPEPRLPGNDGNSCGALPARVPTRCGPGPPT